MKLAESHYDNSETGCCARLERTQWDDRLFTWKEKPFLKDHMRSLFHVPINFGAVMSRAHAAVEQAQAYPLEPFWLTDEVSPWGSDILLATDREVPGAEMVTLSGTFVSKVFEGPYRDVGKWIEAMNQYVASKGQAVLRLYFYYATCPQCAKHFGVNQVVLVAQIE